MAFIWLGTQMEHLTHHKHLVIWHSAPTHVIHGVTNPSETSWSLVALVANGVDDDAKRSLFICQQQACGKI